MKLHEPTFGEDEIAAAVEVLRSTYVTCGEKTARFEEDFCRIMRFGGSAVSCNSGSSAVLLAVAALCNPVTPNYLRPGDEVIVPGLCWSTSVWPLVQHGLIPVFVDCDETFNLDPNEVERAIGPRTRAIMPVHIYGNPCDMRAIGGMADKRGGVFIIEDCCESMGARQYGHFIGDYGLVSAFSFYFSHHATTLEGGMVYTHDDIFPDLLRVLRSHGWTREMENPERHEGIDPKFTFINQGYNLRLTEVQAAIGLVQLPKLEGFIRARRQNAQHWLRIRNEHIAFQKERGESSWFGFPVITEDAQSLKAHLNKHGIETRPIAAGNMARQPGMKLYPHRIVGDLKQTDRIWKHGISWGCHQSVTEEQRQYVTEVVEAYAPAR